MSGRRVLLIHGWRVKDPMLGIGRLVEPLRALGYLPVLLRYGYTLTADQTRFRSRKAAKNWSARTEPGDVVIGHSNGGRVAWEMSHYEQNRAADMVWINPALDPDVVPGRSVRRLLVLHNPFDRAVRLGRMLPGSIWGDLGAVGYQGERDPFGPDPRITSQIYGIGHSPFGEPARLAALIHQWLQTAPQLMETA
jgi:hypothetical protein